VLTAGVVATALFGAPVFAQAAAPAPDAACTLKANPHISANNEWTHCVSVSAALDRVPQLGESVSLRFDVTSQHGNDGVQIEADLPGNLRWEKAPAGLRSAAVASSSPENHGQLNRASGQAAIAAGRTVHFEGSVSAVSAGPAQIRVRARIAVPGGTDSAEDNVFITIGQKGQQSLNTIATPAVGATTPITKAPTLAPQTNHRAVPTDGLPKAPGAGTQATSCVTGGWFYVDNFGNGRPSINAQVEAWSGGTFLASGITGFDGRYSVCFANTPGGKNVFVHFVMKNTIWRLRATGTNNDYAFNSGNLFVGDGATVDFGGLQPADNTLMRGLHAFDAANDAWVWHPGVCWATNHATCRQLNINWANNSVDGTYYSTGANDVHLAADDPNSPFTVVHEVGHGVMDETYNDAFPAAPNCNPHFITAASSAGCAWTEGWAEWFPASVYNNPIFMWPDQSTLNLETPTWNTPGWGNGDTVEGRVAGALIDISDFNSEGPWDVYGEGAPGNVWTTFSNHVSGTFAQFWSQRAADGFNVANNGALSSVYQNTIDIAFCNPLGNYAELTRPTPTPHNYCYNTSTIFWSVTAIRPPAGADYDLRLYDDPAHTALLSSSTFGGNTVDFVAVDSNHRALGDYHPQVFAFSGSGNYQVELAQGADSLGAASSQAVFMGANDVVVVRDVFLTAGTAVTFRAIPGNGTQDAELFLMSSDGANPATLVKGRPQATLTASAAGPGGTEQFTFAPTVNDWYGLVLVNKAGSGTYTLQRS
jgi:hypothetical protein